tara:strand:+ start:520 stop:840 length:321 start_codon:yes stop_codon:yes gene_type:complete
MSTAVTPTELWAAIGPHKKEVGGEVEKARSDAASSKDLAVSAKQDAASAKQVATSARAGLSTVETAVEEHTTEIETSPMPVRARKSRTSEAFLLRSLRLIDDDLRC